MKHSKKCPKCGSLRVAYLPIQPDRHGAYKDQPRSVGMEDAITGFFSDIPIQRHLGELEAYVCAACGYHESYVKKPDSSNGTGSRACDGSTQKRRIRGPIASRVVRAR
jgi:predicted nucleic-acid-binding Zn-ribbon protein